MRLGMGKDEQNMAATGARLREWREAKGSTVREVAQALGVSTQAVYAWENGDNQPEPKRVHELDSAIGAGGAILRLFGLMLPPDDLADVRAALDRIERRGVELDAVLEDVERRLAALEQPPDPPSQ